MTRESPPLRVLSLDGGGMRGTYTATYLDRVAAAFAKRRGVPALDIGAAFDLIAGTSTGGIIACALAAGIPLSNVVTVYVEYGSKIFSCPLPNRVSSVLVDSWRRPGALAAGTAILREQLAKIFHEKNLGEIYGERRIALAIPAIEMSQHRA